MYNVCVTCVCMYVCMYVCMKMYVSMYVCKCDVPSEGIAGADGAGRSAEGACDLRHPMCIKKSARSNFHFMGSPTHMKQELKEPDSPKAGARL